MPNWCDTSYVIEGPIKDIKEIKDAIEHHDIQENSSENWEGNVLIKLGIDPKAFDYMRGFIEEPADLEELPNDMGVLSFFANEAWGVTDFDKAIRSKYPDVNIFYRGEEPDMGVFCTNDAEGKYFPDRFYMEICINNDQDTEVFITEEDMWNWLKDKTNGKITSKKDVDKFNEKASEDDFDEFISYFEYKVCTD